MKKLLVLGYGAKNRSKDSPQSSGKDHSAQYISNHFDLKFQSSSWFACQHFIYDILKDEKGYSSIGECYNDRHSGSNRKLWYDLICDYNKNDPAKLARELFKTNDLYVGLRSIEEFKVIQKTMDVFSLWIDATKRIEPEDVTSCTITADDCDVIITNNGNLEQFDNKLRRFCEMIGK